ncbi:iron-hydroxamate transporter permease subunit [Moraxella macacae 0408225]|uniref:Iron-hydroxamate transporter permease subunit n=1 Tax=Moraxella macacae 0408225 TaxID=1230338 RepID=L2F8B8_9GAMM|nr:Fe(3+)-hydroxamate ABC transporter permease FhuB [Moraxella macacae]ELA09319.1 iron-hydroxamate transporter permease subunit [Moraxella macacae 0408225]
MNGSPINKLTNKFTNQFTKLKTAPVLAFVALLALAMITAWLVIQNSWQFSLALLFAPSQALDLPQLATQLQLLPTMLVAMFAGGLLGVVSVLLQQLVKNTLASDTTLSLGVGAQLALLVVAVFLPSFGVYGRFWVAFVGAMASMGLLFAIAAKSRVNPVVLILGGLVISILFSAVSQLLIIFYPNLTMAVLLWGSGNLTQSSWQNSQFLLAISVILLPILFLLLKPLTLMSLDDRQAKSLGVPVSTMRLVLITLAAMVTASVVSRVGVLSFVGLAAASVVNVLAIRRVGMRLLAGFGFGAALLWLTNNLVALLKAWFGSLLALNLPVGAFTGILGAGLIIWLVLRQSRQQSTQLHEPSAFLMVKRKKIGLSFWLKVLLSLAILTALALFIAPNAVGNLAVQTDVDAMNQFRLPRTLSAMATGVMLAAAGVLLQNLTRNPMASPEVMGVSSGSALGVVLAFVFAPFLLNSGVLAFLGLDANAQMLLFALSGLLGAGVVLAVILGLARKLSPSYLLLVGVAISALMNGVLILIQISGDPRLQTILNWLSGTTYHANPSLAWGLILVAVLLFVASFFILKPLKLIALDTVVAKSLGVSVKRTEIVVLSLVALLSTASTLAIGPLSFVGLMMPHLAIQLGAVQLPKQLALSAILGAMLMLLADWVGRYAIFPYEIPAGVIASVVGGVYFLWLMRRYGG